MSKDIDPYRISPDDVLYIQHRPMLRQEFRLQGLGDPLAEDYPYLVDDEGNFINDASEAPSPASDTGYDEDGFPTNSDKEKPENWNDFSDEEKRAYVYGKDEEDDGDKPEPITLSEDMQWSEENKNKELKAVIDARNADRDPEGDWFIKPEGTTKEDLQKALAADDKRVAEFNESLEGDSE